MWAATKLKYLVDADVATLDDATDPTFEFRYLDIGAVSSGMITIPDQMVRFADAPSRARQVPMPGDVLVSTVRTYLRAVAAVPVSDETLVVSTGFAVLRAGPRLDGGFLEYACQAESFVEAVGAASTGVSYPAISTARLLSLALRHPADLDEQSAIADYLDHETARIDELIDEQTGLAADLSARRSALIAHHLAWPVSEPVSRHFSVVLGKMLDGGRAARDDDVVLPYLRALNIQDRGLMLGSVNEMAFTAAERSHLDLRRGDLLVVEGGAGVANVQVLSEDMPGWSFQKTLNRVRSRTANGNTRFLAYVIRSMRDSGFLDIVCNKSTIPHLTAEKLLALRVPQPPREHQDAVVALLDEQTARIDELIAECRTLITLLKERRAALITAAVTGQIDVRTATSAVPRS